MLMADLVQVAQEREIPEALVVSPYYWHEMIGLAPNLLEGQDAQEWVNQLRDEEWERDWS